MASPTAEQLPEALLPSILQHVPLKQCLASCALVCKAWAPAAAAATRQISLTVRRSGSDSKDSESPHGITVRKPMDSCLEVFGCSGWLQQHGGNLKRLQLEYVDPRRYVSKTRPRVRLPCAALVQLTSLSIAGCMVSISRQGEAQHQQQHQQASAAPGSCPSLPQLVDLKFRLCNFSSSAAYQQLVSSAALTALDMQLMECNDRPQWAAAVDGAPPSTELEAALRTCRGLRSLTLQYWEGYLSMPLSSLVAVSTLQHLQHLDVDLPCTGSDSPSILPHFPASLTGLFLGSIMYDLYVLPRQVRHLTDLVMLHLEQLYFDPRVLPRLSKLQSLELHRCTPLPRTVGQNTPLAALLAAVGTLTQLERLVLTSERVGRDLTRQLQAPSHAFPALTAASQLRALQFQVMSTKDGALPGFVDVLRHKFPTGRQLPQLGTFVLGVTYTKDSAYNSSIEWNVPPVDLAAVATSCPSLHCLRLVGVLQPGDARPLLQFSTVQELWLGGQVLDADAAAVVAKMTQLTVLNLDFTGNTHGFGACKGLCTPCCAHPAAATRPARREVWQHQPTRQCAAGLASGAYLV